MEGMNGTDGTAVTRIRTKAMPATHEEAAELLVR